MSDGQARTVPARPTSGAAAKAVARLLEIAADLRGCAILAPDGALLAASGDPGRWGPAATGLLAAADEAADAPATQVHVATEEAEAFGVREQGHALVAVAERFTLASLLLFDMRTVLRDLVRESIAGSGNGAGAAPSEGA